MARRSAHFPIEEKITGEACYSIIGKIYLIKSDLLRKMKNFSLKKILFSLEINFYLS